MAKMVSKQSGETTYTIEVTETERNLIGSVLKRVSLSVYTDLDLSYENLYEAFGIRQGEFPPYEFGVNKLKNLEITERVW